MKNQDEDTLLEKARRASTIIGPIISLIDTQAANADLDPDEFRQHVGIEILMTRLGRGIDLDALLAEVRQNGELVLSRDGRVRPAADLFDHAMPPPTAKTEATPSDDGIKIMRHVARTVGSVRGGLVNRELRLSAENFKKHLDRIVQQEFVIRHGTGRHVFLELSEKGKQWMRDHPI